MNIRNLLVLCTSLVTVQGHLFAQGFSFPQPEKIYFDAESGKIEAPFEIRELPGASGGKVISIKDKANQRLGKAPGKDFYPGSVEYRFQVKKEGEYFLWMRKYWQDGCGNSVLCTINKPMTRAIARVNPRTILVSRRL